MKKLKKNLTKQKTDVIVLNVGKRKTCKKRKKSHKKKIKILDKKKIVWYYNRVSTRKVPDREPEMRKQIKQININDF